MTSDFSVNMNEYLPLRLSLIHIFYGKELIRSMLAQLLRNPVYVRADMDVYRFFRSHGTNIVSSPEQFDGIHGCYPVSYTHLVRSSEPGSWAISIVKIAFGSAIPYASSGIR